MAQNTTTIADRIEQIEGDFEVEVEVTGGGRGWTATAGEVTVKGTSKMAALDLLAAALEEDAAFAEADEDDESDEDESGCSEECQNARPDSPCSCRCGGANHPREEGSEVIVFGDKPCACGCGLTTKRRFVAGHDARFHFAERAAKAGLDVEAFRKSLKADRNRAAAAKRREKRAADKALAARVVEAVANV